jgi:peptidoglycan/xylan/chitin deacetylase (PgdA/CDA1 family)
MEFVACATRRLFQAGWKVIVWQKIRRWGGMLCRLVPVWLWQRILPEPVVCLCYHMVSDVQVPHVRHYDFLATDEFERDLQDLERRFTYISYEQLVERRSKQEYGPSNSLCLTFDDGFSECASLVRPILLHHGASCIFFVITDLIDNRAVFLETKASLCVDAVLRSPIDEVEAISRDLDLEGQLSTAEMTYRDNVPPQMAKKWQKFEPRLRPLLVWLLTIRPTDAPLLEELCLRLKIDAGEYVETVRPYLSTDQILQLRSDGFAIGAHSCSHRLLQQLPLAEAEREIVESCRVIHELTGQPSVPFAFPYFGGNLDRSWLAKLREQHPFIGLFFDTQGLRRDAEFMVQRVFGERIEETGSIERLLRRAWVRRLL